VDTDGDGAIADLMYTKDDMIHTWPSYGIRVPSSLAIVALFLLFQLSSSKDDHGHGSVDVAVSYTVLSRAFLLEMVSLLRALGSTWNLCLPVQHNVELDLLRYSLCMVWLGSS
jgi:hypothetical protein